MLCLILHPTDGGLKLQLWECDAQTVYAMDVLRIELGIDFSSTKVAYLVNKFHSYTVSGLKSIQVLLLLSQLRADAFVPC